MDALLPAPARSLAMPRLLPMVLLAWQSGCAAPAGAQQLRGLVDRAADGIVAVQYAARADVCGSDAMLRIGYAGDLGVTRWLWTRHEGWTGDPCERGPVRVLQRRADRRVTSVQVTIATSPLPDGVQDLGAVSAVDAARYFVDLATASDGRLGREALLAAVVADSADLAPALTAIATGDRHSRGLRESAVSWLGRELAESGARGSAIARTLADLARDPEVPQSVRARAAGALSHGGGSGTAVLAELTRVDHVGVARAALSALARSDDPRARDAIRAAARDASRPDRLRVEAIKALGNRDATPADLDAVRSLWSTVESAEPRAAILDVLAEAGGAANTEWLLGIARDSNASSTERARAVRAAERAGARTPDLVRVFDEGADRRVKEAVLDALARIGDRGAQDKLHHAAEHDTDPSIRKAALRRLARVGGDDARAALESIVER